MGLARCVPLPSADHPGDGCRVLLSDSRPPARCWPARIHRGGRDLRHTGIGERRGAQRTGALQDPADQFEVPAGLPRQGPGKRGTLWANHMGSALLFRGWRLGHNADRPDHLPAAAGLSHRSTRRGGHFGPHAGEPAPSPGNRVLLPVRRSPGGDCDSAAVQRLAGCGD